MTGIDGERPMIVTTYTCDRCNQSQTTHDQMWHVGIMVKHFNTTQEQSQNKQLWCRKCVVDIGLLTPSPAPKGIPAPQPPSFEDMLREIIREEIQEQRTSR